MFDFHSEVDRARDTVCDIKRRIVESQQTDIDNHLKAMAVQMQEAASQLERTFNYDVTAHKKDIVYRGIFLQAKSNSVIANLLQRLESDGVRARLVDNSSFLGSRYYIEVYF